MTQPAELQTNAPFPRAGQGLGVGVIETVKRAVIVALREALVGTTLGNRTTNDSYISVDMEYPMEKEQYPGIWVQFSFSRFVQAGIGHQPLQRTVVNEGQDDEYVNWEPIREFIFEGRVTLSIMALTSLERDQISDAVSSMLLFSRPPEQVLTDPARDSKQFRQLLTNIAQNPYVSMTINQDMITPGGQNMTTGVPWDEELPGYEDSYSFDIQGQTNIVFHNDGTYTLRSIVEVPEVADRYDWI